MKIVFICGSLEPARDGVGDYTRRMAAAIIAQGHQAAVIALHDLHVKTITTTTQETDGLLVQVLRLPAGLSEKAIVDAAKPWIDAFQPDWLSLQFVPFAYHPKGLGIGLGKLLLQLGGARPWNIMIHELWVGMGYQAGTMEVLWGMAQRRLIRSLFKKLRPRVIHTQSLLYQMHIAGLGFKAVYLPLFSNIPVVKQAVRENGYTNTLGKPASAISLVIFGSILPGAPIDAFSSEAASYAKEKNITVSLTLIGRTGAEQKRWANAWQQNGLPVTILGEQPAGKISEALHRANYGISSTVIDLTDKSGSVAALREHGLPVICVAPFWQSRRLTHGALHPTVAEYHKGNLETCFKSTANAASVHTVSAISRQLVTDLSAAL